MMSLAEKPELHLCTLAQLKKGEKATITHVVRTDVDDAACLCRRLMEIGFFTGENVSIVAESFPRRDPLAVRVGDAIFALGRKEASMIHVSRHLPA